MKATGIVMMAVLGMTPVEAQQTVADAQQRPGAKFLEQWDADSDGQVTLDEARQRRADMFEMFDQDSDGGLSAKELDGIDDFRSQMQQANRGAMGAGNGMAMGNGLGGGMGMGGGLGMGGGRGAPPGPGRLDADGNGTIGRDEFVQGTGFWFSMRDRDGDGVLTVQDFGKRR